MPHIRLRHKYLTYAITSEVWWIRFCRIYFYMKKDTRPSLKYIWKEKKYAKRK